MDAKIEELVEGDLKLKEDESLPKEVPIKRKKENEIEPYTINSGVGPILSAI